MLPNGALGPARSGAIHRAPPIQAWLALIVLLLLACISPAAAHPLGNFTINHFTRIEPGRERVRVWYVVDMAEIAALQALQRVGKAGAAPAPAELDAYADRAGAAYAAGLRLSLDGAPVRLALVSRKVALPPGAGGMPTLRLECELQGNLPAAVGDTARRVTFADENDPERIGWHEIVVSPGAGVSVFDSTAYGSPVTDELRAYPPDRLSAPLNERAAQFSARAGPAPAGAKALLTRDGHAAAPTRDRLAELIAAREVTPLVAVLGLVLAFIMGAGHAFSPGHGKTVVGAYLVGSRGTARHAAFLGLTVTITHTIGVFALGLVTLFASEYVLPERLFPILSLLSGAILFLMGAGLFVQRLRALVSDGKGQSAKGKAQDPDASPATTPPPRVPPRDQPLPDPGGQGHDHAHSHSPGHGHSHGHAHSHSHGSLFRHPKLEALTTHSHLPPGADGEAVTWRSLLALGISGGLLPCPSALIVLLSAVSLHRVAYGLLLVLAFSMGLATTLTLIGLLFVWSGQFLKSAKLPGGRLLRVVPVFSALVIAVAGGVICYEALTGGTHLGGLAR